MNYWYIARPNELFLDIDNAARSLKHARSRLQGAIECGKFNVAYVMQRTSKNKDHLHVIVTLTNNMHGVDRFVWEIILHSDLYRGCCNIMREITNLRSLKRINMATGVLISPWSCFVKSMPDGLSRKYDYECDCNSKHNAATMETCPAAIRLRGEFRNVGFFGKPSKNPCTIWPEL